MLLHINVVCTMEFTKKDILGLVAEGDSIPLLSPSRIAEPLHFG